MARPITISDLRRAGAKPVPKDEPFMIMAVKALPGKGKTHFSLTAPPPIAFFDMDDGITEIRDKFDLTDDQLLHFPVPYDGEDDVIAEKALNNMAKQFDMCINAPNDVVRSIVIDSDSELWEMIRLARFGRLKDVKPDSYGPVNREYMGYIKRAKKRKKNLILINQMKEEWVSPGMKKGKKAMAQWTGNFIPDRMKKTQYLIQVDVEMFVDELGFNLRVDKCRKNPYLVGEVLTTEFGNDEEKLDMCNFKTLACMVMEDTEMEDWE
jgi:hypothetical protein